MIAICPTREQLKSLSLGQLPEIRSDELISHLQRCQSCQAEMGTLDTVEDTFVNRLRSAGLDEPLGNDAFGEEADCKKATVRALAALASVEPEAIDPSDSSSLLHNIPRTIGEYEIVEPLGHGGMGRVYLGRHTKLGRPVAIKFIADHRRWDQSMHDRFAKEMRLIGRLNHPNIVAASDAREVDGLAVLVTEFIDGLDVSEIVKRTGPLSVADATSIVCEVCNALQYIDSQGLVHRDVKPSNIMIDQNGSVKLLDLGLARLHSSDPEFGEFTATGQAMGTADYVAPEQINDGRNIDARTDIYGLGCTLYKLLCGQAPFAGPEHQTVFAKMNAHVSEIPQSLEARRADLPRDLITTVRQMLEKDPSDRPQSAEQVAARLANLAADADLSTLVQSSKQPSAPKTDQAVTESPKPKLQSQSERGWIARHPLIATLAAASAALLFGLWLGITITVKKPDGTTATVQIPDGSTAIVDAEGNIEILLADGLGRLSIPKENVSNQRREFSAQSEQSASNEQAVVAGQSRDLAAEDGSAFLFMLSKSSSLFDQIEAFDYVDVIGVPKQKLSDFRKKALNETGLVSQVIASKKPVTAINRSGNSANIYLNLNSAEERRLVEATNAGLKAQIEFHDPDRKLLADRIRMDGVWRIVLQRIGGSVSTNLPEQTILILRDEFIRFDTDGIARVKLTLSQSGDQQRFTTDDPGNSQQGLFRFLENGRMEFATNLDSQRPVDSFEDAQILWRLERVTEPKTDFEKQAFQIVESAKVADTILECFVAEEKIERPDQGLTILQDSDERKEIEYDGTAYWLLGNSFLSNEDILAAEIERRDGQNPKILVQVTEAAGERMRSATTNNLNKRIAIVVDGKVIRVPRIVEPISGTRFVLSGDFTNEEAENLADGIVPSLKLPPGVKDSNAISRTGSMNNLRLLALAMLNYESAYKRFPNEKNSAEGTDDPPFSWRIALLPFLEGQLELYKQYRFKEPWDSEANLKLLDKMPDVFRHPTADKNSTMTNYTLFVGDNTAITNEKIRRFADFIDGSSNSILMFEADTAIPWTKPEDLPFDENWFKRLKLIDEDGLAVAIADGSINFLVRQIVNEETLLPLITINDGKAVDISRLRSEATKERRKIIGN